MRVFFNEDPPPPFICKFPFVSVSKSASGICAPCCRYGLDKEDLKDNDLKGSVEKAFNSKTFKKIRSKILRREKLTGCQKCYDEEACGKKSFGRRFTEEYAFDFSLVELKSLQISLSRECNLACKMCSPTYSTKWDAIWNKLESTKINLKCNFELKDIISSKETLKNIKHLDIVGGEPFINDSFYKLLDQLKNYDTSNKLIDISTNCTFFPKQKYIDILLGFKKICVGLSIDGLNQLGEYIRFYSNWTKIEKVVDKWKQVQLKNPSLSIQIQTSISAYNAHDLYNIYKWCLEKKIYWNCQFVYNPKHLSVKVLPKKLRNKIYDYYLQFPDFQNQLLKLKKHFIVEPSGKLAEFLEYTDKLDKILGTSFFEINKFYSRKDLLN